MKRLWLILSLLLAGCANIHYSAVRPDGTKVEASARSFFSATAVKGFVSDSSTEKTKTGLRFSSSETQADTAWIQAIIEAAIKASK